MYAWRAAPGRKDVAEAREDNPCSEKSLWPIDHEQLRQDFLQMLRNSIKMPQQKWNFDFLWETPLKGLLQWEELEGREMLAFNHSCVLAAAQRPLQH